MTLATLRKPYQLAAGVFLASVLISARAEVCPNALDYLDSTFLAAKQTLTKHFAGRFYVNGPGCSENDYELDLNDPRDIADCSLSGRRKLTHFTVIGFSDIDAPFNVRYIFDGPAPSITEISALLGGLQLESTKEIPSPLRRLFRQPRQSDLYLSTDKKYLVRVFEEHFQQKISHTIMVVKLLTIASARENISVCLRAHGISPDEDN